MRRNCAVHRMNYPIVPQGTAMSGVQWEGTAEHFVGWHAYFRNAYEPETLAIIAAILRPGMRMIELLSPRRTGREPGGRRTARHV